MSLRTNAILGVRSAQPSMNGAYYTLNILDDDGRNRASLLVKRAPEKLVPLWCTTCQSRACRHTKYVAAHIESGADPKPVTEPAHGGEPLCIHCGNVWPEFINGEPTHRDGKHAFEASVVA